MMGCPCCGFRAGNRDPLDIGRVVRLSPLERAIFDLLRKRFGQTMSAEQIADYAYADDPNGGPENTRVVIAVTVHRLRKKIEPYGLTIQGTSGAGGGRRMRWLAE